MKLNAATLKAATELGINRSQIEDYALNGQGTHMSDEIAGKCLSCLEIGKTQDMSDEDYEKYYQEEEPQL